MTLERIVMAPTAISSPYFSREVAKLTNQIEYEQERQKEIEELKGKVNTDEYIEKMASEKLGLIKSNAKVFVDVSGEQQ